MKKILLSPDSTDGGSNTPAATAPAAPVADTGATESTLSAAIDPVIDGAADVAATLAPQYGALILLGAGLLKEVPELYQDALNLVQKKDPTDADNAALQAKISALENPANL